MGKIAVVFPGQGAQVVGMGKDFYESFESAKQVIEKANETLGFDLKKLMFEGPIEELTKTENTQPALVAACTAILNVLKEKGLKYDGAAGHSLGEYSAYVAAEKLSLEDALNAVRQRGLLMSKADPDKRGAMAAVMKMEQTKVEEICNKYENVVPANYNSPVQIVISGDKDELEKVCDEIEEENGRVIILNVSGPFHSPLMAPAAKEFENVLKDINIKDSSTPLYANVTAVPVENGKEKELLQTQINNPVKWTQTIQNMINDGYDTFIEIGPGKVLQGLIKKIDRSVKTYGVGDVASIEKLDILN